mgnify:CR=1 FL=1
MMNLSLYVESRRTLAKLLAEAGPCPLGKGSWLSYPEDIFEDLRQEVAAAIQSECTREDLPPWQPAPRVALSY